MLVRKTQKETAVETNINPFDEIVEQSHEAAVQDGTATVKNAQQETGWQTVTRSGRISRPASRLIDKIGCGAIVTQAERNYTFLEKQV